MAHYQAAFEARKTSLEALTEDESQLATIRAEMQIKEAELNDQKAQKQSFLKDVRSKRQTALQLLAEKSINHVNLYKIDSMSPYPHKDPDTCRNVPLNVWETSMAC